MVEDHTDTSLICVLIGDAETRIAVRRVDDDLVAFLEERVENRWLYRRILADGKDELRILTKLMGQYSNHGLLSFERPTDE